MSEGSAGATVTRFTFEPVVTPAFPVRSYPEPIPIGLNRLVVVLPPATFEWQAIRNLLGVETPTPGPIPAEEVLRRYRPGSGGRAES